VGVFVGSRRGTVGAEAQDRLRRDRAAIDGELGFAVAWADDDPDSRHFPICSRDDGDLNDPSNRAEVLAWLRTRTNSFINVIRPRVAAIARDMGL